LTYLEADSSIALMTIPAFSAKSFSTFYKKSFEQLRAANTQTLIIDLRNNPGGSLKNIQTLYAYLTDTSFYFTSKAEIASRTSLLRSNPFKNSPVVVKILSPILYPAKLISMGITLSKIKQEDGKYYHNLYSAKRASYNPLYFKGDVYVLINGRSFSASSILSSNLHGAKRAVFVGEETGGAYNGCVAGQYYMFTLPKSKLKGQFGMATIQPFYQTDTEGRGIMPDIEVIPTLEDRINGNDPELNTILELVRSKE
jgi:C-terminal processing protease CtpA/Prc